MKRRGRGLGNEIACSGVIFSEMIRQRRAILLFVRDERRESVLKPLPVRGVSYGMVNRRIAERIASVDADLIIVAETEEQAGPEGIVQHGESFGHRLVSAAADAFGRGYENVVVVGNDCPTIERSDIDLAFKTLAEGPIVAAPTTDGGAFLVGFRRNGFNPAPLISLPWCTPSLYRAFMALDGAQGLPILRSDFDNWNALKARHALALLLGTPIVAGRSLRKAFFLYTTPRKALSRAHSPAP